MVLVQVIRRTLKRLNQWQVLPFDTLNTEEDNDKLGASRGISNTANNVANHPNIATTSLRTNKEGVGSVNRKDKESDLAHKISESCVEEVHNDTCFMASMSRCEAGRKILYERWKYDYDDNRYDEDECEDLVKDQLELCEGFDIRLHGHA
ncbi:hypothetical protein Tco_0608746 [Tanacetum coccineum]